MQDDNEMQVGGLNINKFLKHGGKLQHAGKKIKKRIYSTRHAFKNISKNVTRKNKLFI
jgi:hypothetical protein